MYTYRQLHTMLTTLANTYYGMSKAVANGVPGGLELDAPVRKDTHDILVQSLYKFARELDAAALVTSTVVPKPQFQGQAKDTDEVLDKTDV